ncbi:T cell receptor alpha chain MC.7.G5-like isoform X3 [Falco peregrinus]|uniref:T cell receptor alpha chain MC.7.G5-like isoform X3 n=1 Tax=Falco peregrinus TaxID=8954 RepID=UPI00247A4C32|nr:T cell receptor alpha chain MC.7.G5-like isoform X3 [Falco peregrinus]
MALIVLAALAGLAAFGHAQKDSVLQFPAEMTIQRGHSTALRCNFSTSSASSYIFWYQQRQTQSPQMLLQGVYKWKPQVDSGRFSSSLSVETSQVVLHVRDAELQDSAAYFCALSPHSGSDKLTFGSGTRLSIQPNVTPSPSVYKLISKDDEDLEMCLITDYSPGKLKGTDKQTSAVVEVTTSESKPEASYLSTYWAKKDKMWCGANHEGFGELEAEDPESGASTVCVTGISLHFRTDENLNMLSLSHLSLKIISMKVIIFNVLMTMLMRKKKNESNQMVQS